MNEEIIDDICLDKPDISYARYYEEKTWLQIFHHIISHFMLSGLLIFSIVKDLPTLFILASVATIAMLHLHEYISFKEWKQSVLKLENKTKHKLHGRRETTS